MPGLIRTTNRSAGAEMLRHGGRIVIVNRGEGSVPASPVPPPPLDILVRIEFEGTNGSSVFPDTSEYARTITPSAPTAPTISTAQAAVGLASGYFPGDAFLTIPNSTDFAFGQNNFSVRFRIRLPDVGYVRDILSGNNVRVEFSSVFGELVGILVQVLGTSFNYTAFFPVAANTWIDFEMKRTNGIITFSLDAIPIARAYYLANLTLSDVSGIKIAGDGELFLDQFEIGVALGTAPTEPAGNIINVPSITYTQTGFLDVPGMALATNANMTNGVTSDSGTVTDPGGSVIMDLGSICIVKKVFVGWNSSDTVPGFPSQFNTLYLWVEISDDNVNWTYLFATNSLPDPITVYDVSASGRFIKIKDPYDSIEICVTEFYATSS